MNLCNGERLIKISPHHYKNRSGTFYGSHCVHDLYMCVCMCVWQGIGWCLRPGLRLWYLRNGWTTTTSILAGSSSSHALRVSSWQPAFHQRLTTSPACCSSQGTCRAAGDANGMNVQRKTKHNHSVGCVCVARWRWILFKSMLSADNKWVSK